MKRMLLINLRADAQRERKRRPPTVTGINFVAQIAKCPPTNITFHFNPFRNLPPAKIPIASGERFRSLGRFFCRLLLIWLGVVRISTIVFVQIDIKWIIGPEQKKKSGLPAVSMPLSRGLRLIDCHTSLNKHWNMCVCLFVCVCVCVCVWERERERERDCSCKDSHHQCLSRVHSSVAAADCFHTRNWFICRTFFLHNFTDQTHKTLF